MDPSRYQRVKDCFARALDVPAEELDAFLDEECRGDPTLRAEVESLLGHSARKGDALEGLLAEPLKVPGEPPGTLPEYISHFRILGVAGRGGMGIVYEAEQEKPRRVVALKVMDVGVMGSQTQRRFQLETEVLGRLHHPGIAQIYEAGTFETEGATRPFFAMELVRGRPITEHAERNKLGIEERIRLLVATCEAVHHAHERGVIHRDLKPANVLVTEAGEPKILDFGVARATDVDLQSVTLQTNPGQIVGTVPYMSPEQAACEPDLLDERTDVYSLGVLAYELLSGRLPLQLEGCSLQESLRQLQEEEPSRLGTLNRALRGDVETIVGKALSKEPDRRYATAAELAEDLARFLRHEPIVARPTSAVYQLRKFARRNKALVGGIASGVGIAFLALTTALVVSMDKTREARRSEQRALIEADRASVSAAAAAIELGDLSSARRLLSKVPEERREWEWHLYDAQTDTSVFALDLEEPVAAFSFDAEAREVVVAEADGRIRRWSLASGELSGEARIPGPLPYHGYQTKFLNDKVAMDAAGTRLAVLRANVASVYDTGTGAMLAEHAFDAHVDGITVSPDASCVALCGSSGFWMWPFAAGPPRRIQDRRTERLAYSSDGLLMTQHYGGENWGRVQIIDARGVPLKELQFRNRVSSMVLRAGGESYGFSDGMYKVAHWRNVERDADLVFSGHKGTVRLVAWSDAAQLLATASDDLSVRTWMLGEDEPDLRLFGLDGPPRGLRFGPRGELLAAWSLRGVRVWDLSLRSADIAFQHPTYVYGTAFTPDGRPATLDFRGTFRVWDEDGRAVLERESSRAPSRMATAADGALHARWSWGSFSLKDGTWEDVASASLELKFGDVALSADGSRVALRGANSIHVFASSSLDAPLLERDWEYAPAYSSRYYPAVALSGDGRRVATETADHVLRIWDVDSGEVLMERPWTEYPVSLRFSPDDSLLACGGHLGGLLLWHLEDEERTLELQAHAERVYALAFTPDGRRLASGGNDSTLRLWDTADGEQVAMIGDHGDYVFALAFSRDGTRLLSGSGDGTARLWHTAPRHARRSGR